jgi:hypothetical protein
MVGGGDSGHARVVFIRKIKIMKEGRRTNLQWVFGILSLPFVAISLFCGSLIWVSSETNAVLKLQEYKDFLIRNEKVVFFLSNELPVMWKQLKGPDFASNAYEDKLSEFTFKMEDPPTPQGILRGMFSLPVFLYSQKKFIAILKIFLLFLAPLVIFWLPYISLAPGYRKLRNIGLSGFIIALPSVFLAFFIKEKLPLFVVGQFKNFIASGPAGFAPPDYLFAFLKTSLEKTLSSFFVFYFVAVVVFAFFIILSIVLSKLSEKQDLANAA